MERHGTWKHYKLPVLATGDWMKSGASVVSVQLRRCCPTRCEMCIKMYDAVKKTFCTRAGTRAAAAGLVLSPNWKGYERNESCVCFPICTRSHRRPLIDLLKEMARRMISSHWSGNPQHFLPYSTLCFHHHPHHHHYHQLLPKPPTVGHACGRELILPG